MDSSTRKPSRRKSDHENQQIPYFAAMLEASKATGLPRNFATDLTTHDRDALLRLAPGHQHESVTRIGWFLYRSGTHLVLLTDREQLDSKKARALADDPDAVYFVGEAGVLRQVTADEWIHFMTRADRVREAS